VYVYMYIHIYGKHDVIRCFGEGQTTGGRDGDDGQGLLLHFASRHPPFGEVIQLDAHADSLCIVCMFACERNQGHWYERCWRLDKRKRCV
jgi:hypothetical protein